MKRAMALQLPHRTHLRRAAITAALGAALIGPAVAPAAERGPVASAAKAAKAKKAKPTPVVRVVRPMQLSVGEKLEIHGRNFLRGRNKNSVVFQRAGAKAVFVRAEIATAKLIRVTVPEKLGAFLVTRDGAPAPTRFRIRILAARFGKRFTKDAGSPTIHPKAAVVPGTRPPVALVTPTGIAVQIEAPKEAPADGDCDGDKILNGADGDDDDDLLGDALELSLGLDPCKADSDGDQVGDGYEYQSARDLNDDEYEEANTSLPYPGKRPYPNPLDGTDAGKDFDGDVLTLADEHKLWVTYDTTPDLALLYSDGNQFSVHTREGGTGRRVPALRADGYDRHQAFLGWAAANRYRTLLLSVSAPYFDASRKRPFGLLDADRDGTESSARPDADYLVAETTYFDFALGRDSATGLVRSDGFLSDNERDEDADGLTNYDESHGRMTAEYWSACYGMEAPHPVAFKGTDLSDPDTDGDGVLDGADDQDFDDIPNVMELSRNAASGHADWNRNRTLCTVDDTLAKPRDSEDPNQEQDDQVLHHPDDYGRVNPFNPCLPYTWSRTCTQHPGIDSAGAPFDNSPDWYALQ